MTWLATFGETMGLCSGRGSGALRVGTPLTFSFGGAESNVAVGLSRLGVPTSWFGRVGDDDIGHLIFKSLRGEQVDISHATIDSDRPTGLMVKWSPRHNRTSVLYYRKHAAASALSPDHIPMRLVVDASVLLVTGITPALSPSAREAVFAAVEEARANGTLVCFDPNFRGQLWTAAQARPVLLDLVRRADMVLLGAREARVLCREQTSMVDAVKSLADLGPRRVVAKLGPAGALAWTADGFHEVSGRPVRVVDPVGAGDGFAAGFLSGIHDALPDVEAIDRGLQVAAAVVSDHGDWEGLPDLRQLADELAGDAEMSHVER